MALSGTEAIKPIFYLAPLQGFTDYSFRQAFYSLFSGPEIAFSPFIDTYRLDHRAFRDVLPERNQGIRLIPQILGNKVPILLDVIRQLQDFGYTEFNLNLGCPYPMVTRKNMGAGLLPQPDLIYEILQGLFDKGDINISLKMRLGLHEADEWKVLIPIINRYPLREVIVHGRTAHQMYTGEVNTSAFIELAGQVIHPLCFNGNIFTLDNFLNLSQKMPFVSRWMIGRGLLSNPLLLEEIRSNQQAGPEAVKKALQNLHDQLIYQNSLRVQGETHLIQKVRPYWEYFAWSLKENPKGLKKIKKASTYPAYMQACQEVFKS